MVVSHQPLLGPDVLAVVRRPSGQQHHQLGVEGDEPVIAKLADRDPQPIGIPDQRDGVGGKATELTGPHSGVGQHLDHQPIARESVGPSGSHQLGCVLVVQELGQRKGSGSDVAVEKRVHRRDVGPVPLDDALEEDPDHPQPMTLGVLAQMSITGPGLDGQPHLVVLDVCPSDGRNRGHLGLGGHPADQLAQRGVGQLHAP